MTERKPALRMSLLLVGALAVAGCSSDRFSNDPASVTGPAARPAAPPVNMAGRWVLASPGRGQCNVTFGAAAPNTAEGTIAPEGGCPGQFFTSRKWSFDSTGLAISNHNADPLAQLSFAGGRFSGQSTAGEPITLTR